MATLQNVVGDLNRNSSLHYFGAIPDLPSALAYAAMMKMIVGTTGGFSTFPDDMTAPLAGGATNNLCLGLYNKGIEHPGLDLPNNFYAHDSKGAKINIFNSSIYLMQADRTVSTAFSDPRGFTATSWKDWKSKDVWQITNDENAKYTNDPYNTGYLDSLSATKGLGGVQPVSLQDGHTYSANQ